ncbi:membrane protein (plasmid) [Erwinia rhapontici]|uniref:MipA/OmpV family protein n=1 Tax=Erwinia rhapontici TaxID=55212 RepID=UPI001BB3E659|nr:MipA/OmpV family protein [Erwinia rhapontici]BCQ42461.1 membrane protein [Erwinia rhapontici]
MKKIIMPFLLVAAFNSHASNDAPGISDSSLNLGIAAGWSTGPYRDYSNKILPLPIISYEGTLVYLRGAEAGFKLYSSETDEITLSASLLPLMFKPEDAKNRAFKNLNERKMSAMAGMGWTHKVAWGFTSLNARHRVTGNKEGAIFGASYGYPFHFDKATLMVTAGLDYSTDEMNKNYFGITAQESAKSELTRYSPGSGYAPYVGFLAVYPLTKSIDLSAGTRLTRLSEAVHESPMTDNRYTHSFVTSVSYRF